jgi:hypothetical protein
MITTPAVNAPSAPATSATVLPEIGWVPPLAAVKFLGNAVEVDQGGVAIATSGGLAAQVEGLTITPAAKKQSKFEVADLINGVFGTVETEVCDKR